MVFQIVDCMVCSLYRAHAVLIPCFIASRTCFHPPSRAGRYSTGIFYKAIKYSLSCAIQDVTRVCAHIASALSLWKVRESESETILALSEAGILPKEFAGKIKGMPAFRNRIIHDYLPNEFDALKLFEVIQNLEDFGVFSKQILKWLENNR